MANGEQAQKALEELNNRGVLTGERYKIARELNSRGELTYDRLQQIVQAGTKPAQVQTTPVEPQRESIAVPEQIAGGARVQPGFLGADLQTKQRVDPAEAAAAQRGVLTQGGAPAGRELAGFTRTEDERKAVLREQLTAHFREKGYDQAIDVRTSPAGRLEFYDPEAERYRDVEGFDFTLSDVSAGVPESIPTIAGIAGGIARARKAPGIRPVVEGEGGGAAAGEAFRQTLGMVLGVTDPTYSEFFSDVALRGAEESAYAFGGGLTAKMLNRMVVGRAVPTDEAKHVLEKAKTTDDIFNELEKRGYKVEASPSQRANFEAWLDQEATLRASADGSRLARQFEELNTNNHRELSRFFNDWLAPSNSPTSRRQLARTLAEQIADEGKKGVRQSKQVTERLREAMQADVRSMPDLDEASIGNIIRGKVPDLPTGQGGSGLLAARQRANEIVHDKWRVVDELSGRAEGADASAVKIPVDDTFKNAIRAMDKTRSSAILDMTRSQKGRLLGGMPSRLVKSENTIDILGPDGSVIKSIELDEKAMDFAALQTALSDLKQWTRKAERSVEIDAPSVRDANRLIDAFTESRNSYLRANNPELLAAVREAERATKKFHDQYTRSVVGDILRQESGEFTMRNRDVFRRVLAKNNPEEASEIADILKGDAPSMRKVKQSIIGLYRQEAVKDGEVNRTLHRRFMDQYGPTISQFLSPDELRRIEKSGNLAESIESSIKAADARERAFKNSLQGRLERMNSEAMVEGIFARTRSKGGSSFTIQDTEDLANWLGRQNPELLLRVRDATADQLSRRIRTPSGYLDLNKIDKVLESTGDFSLDGKLSALFGEQYVKDLRLLRDTLEVTGRKGQAVRQEGKALSMVGLTRRWFTEPLSMWGRRATVAQDIYEKFSRSSFNDALTNPKSLRRLVEMRDKAVTRERIASVLAPVLGNSEASDIADIIFTELQLQKETPNE